MSSFAPALIALTFINALCFAWGVYAVFRNVKPRSFGLKVVKLCGVTAALVQMWQLYEAQPSLIMGLCATAGFLGSLALFFSCVRTTREVPLSLAFSDDAPTHLCSRGPYRFLRHPFYTSYMMTYIAGLMAAPTPYTVAVVITMHCIYCVAVRHEEAKFATSPLAARYEVYKDGTALFFPGLSRRLFRRGFAAILRAQKAAQKDHGISRCSEEAERENA